MSTQRQRDYAEDELSEDRVRDYLRVHPDFFERHAELLGSLYLPHASGGAVSLVERQVSVLRQKDLKMERRLKDLIEVARANDTLAAKIHELSLQLLAADDIGTTITALEETVRSSFGADQAVLVVFGAPDSYGELADRRFLRVVDRDDESLQTFSTFLDSDNPRCGQVRDAQLRFLFRDDAGEVGSVALVPLGSKSAQGFLAVGSMEKDRFHPGMSMDFLARIGDLVAAALRRY